MNKDVLNTQTSPMKSGFSILEMAMVMIIIGIIFAMIGPVYSLYKKNEAIRTTERNVQVVTAAIGNFRSVNGRYPCPASVTATREDPEYGHEGQCNSATGVYNGLAFGACHSSGVCKQRASNNFTDPDPLDIYDEDDYYGVWGAIPFRTLNLQESEAYDGYGMRLRYNVTKLLTAPATFNAGWGSIEILNDQGESALVPPSSAHFVVLSHGANQAGGYSKSGANISCNSAGSKSEKMNCKAGPGGPTPYPPGVCTGGVPVCAVYSAIETSDAAPNQFDDVLTYFVRDDLPLWQAATDPFDMHQTSIGSASDVGFGITPNLPAGTKDAKSLGDVRAMRNMIADQYCNSSGGECFPAEVIAGKAADSSGGMYCPSGEFMIGIANSQPICTDDITVYCAGGDFITGFNEDGTLLCASGACEPFSTDVCGTPESLPLGKEGQSFTFEGGVDLVKTYTCTSTGWDLVQNGACDCLTDTETNDITDCTLLGLGWSGTGTVTRTREYLCPQREWTPWEVNGATNPCTCTDTADTKTGTCPTGYTGDVFFERNLTCDPNIDGDYSDAVWSDWSEYDNTCTCEDKVVPRTLDCPAGFAGAGIFQENTFSCATSPPSWSGYKEVGRDCTCDPTTEPQEDANGDCPPGMTGTAYRERVWDCSIEDWGPWVTTDTSGCYVPPVTICAWSASGAGNAHTSPISAARVGDPCSCGATGPCYDYITKDSYNNFNKCQCD